MIADEVMSGFGRTGKWFAVEHWDVVPDIMTMAKGLTSAYAPLGAVAMKPEIAAAFDEQAFESGLTCSPLKRCQLSHSSRTGTAK
jgi:taurine--2-oxoglutarate transaminase